MRTVEQRAVGYVVLVAQLPQRPSADGRQPVDLIPVVTALPSSFDWPVGRGHFFSPNGALLF